MDAAERIIVAGMAAAMVAGVGLFLWLRQTRVRLWCDEVVLAIMAPFRWLARWWFARRVLWPLVLAAFGVSFWIVAWSEAARTLAQRQIKTPNDIVGSVLASVFVAVIGTYYLLGAWRVAFAEEFSRSARRLWPFLWRAARALAALWAALRLVRWMWETPLF